MDFSNFENIFFSKLEKRDEDILNVVINNQKIVKEYLNENNSKDLQFFVNKFNNIALRNKKNFNIYENILNEKIFYDVLKEFRNSDILIKACEAKNTELINWLLTMNINACVQNDYGVTALMVASKDPDLLFVVKHLLKCDSDNMNLCDMNGETALFYAIDNIDAFRLLLDSNINANCLNKNKDSILTYCCRNKIYGPVKTLSVKDNVDANVFDKYERTALMYLMEDLRFEEIKFMIDKKNINLYYENSRNETAMSIFFKKFYEAYKEINIDKVIPCIKIIQILTYKNINLNISIDEEGNTPMMFFLMIEDWVTLAYLILGCKNLDLSVKNKKGENFSSLCAKHRPTKQSTYSGINAKFLMYHIFSHPTFDASYRGVAGINVLMDYIIFYLQNNDLNFKEILKAHKEFLTVTTDDQENLLIVATKLGRRDVINPIVAEGGNINQQDILGNTALHYAVMLNDYFIADLLAYNHADINIKNKEGKSPINLAKEANDSTMLKFLLKPCPSYKFEKKEKKSNSLFSFGTSYEFRELNENLRKKYQEKYLEVIKSENNKKNDYKYLPNETPKFNTEYFHDVFNACFPQVKDLYNFNPLIGNALVCEASLLGFYHINLPPHLYNMLTNKNILQTNMYLNVIYNLL